MRDERRHPRVAASLRIRLGFGALGELVERRTRDVSQGGLFVQTRDLVAVGTPVTIELRESEGQVARGTGVVARAVPPSAPGEPHRDPGVAIEFRDLDPAGRAIIDRLIAAGEPPVPWPGPAPTPTPMPVSARPPQAGKRSPVVGIDLGTTNSCVAVAEGGRPRILVSREGYHSIPSVVAYDAQGRLLVGHPAKGQMIVNPRNTVYGSKRILGRPFTSPTVQSCRDRFHYEIVEGSDGSAAVRFAGRDFTLQQITAYVLGELREIASQALGEEIRCAVVTVPAYYNDHQRNAVRAAGKLAGLEVSRIVNEPTAAALAFGFGRGLSKRVLVYDLGGGTFDASVLEIEGDVYEVMSTGGDTFLGGADFDARLVDHLAAAFERRHRRPLPDDPVVRQRLRDVAEETKVALSARESARVEVPFLCAGLGGEELALELEVTRAELEGLTAPLVERTIDVVRDVLSARGIAVAQIDEVLLVGGQSRMPLVSRRVREFFAKEPSHGAHPDEAVAQGAALLAESETRIDSVVLIDVLAMAIGVGLPGGGFEPILPRNTRLPAKKSYDVATEQDGQEVIELAVFQGDSPRAAECEYLGTLRVDGLPAAPAGSVKVTVELALGAEGILSIKARNLATGATTRADLATRDTPEQLRAKLRMSEPPTAPRGARPIDSPGPAGRNPRKGLLGRIFGKR